MNWESVPATIRFGLWRFCFVVESGLGPFLDYYRIYLESGSLYKETNHIIYYMIIISSAPERRRRGRANRKSMHMSKTTYKKEDSRATP